MPHKTHILRLAVIGFFSALLSSAISNAYNDTIPLYTPGIVFGVCIGLYFSLLQKKRNWLRLVLFVVLSVLSYYTAVLVGIPLLPFGILLGGAIGTILFVLSFGITLYKLSLKHIYWLLLIGISLCGLCFLDFYAIMSLFSAEQEGFYMLQLSVLLLVWQIGMAAALGIVTDPATHASSLPKASTLLYFVSAFAVVYLAYILFEAFQVVFLDSSAQNLYCLGAC